MSNVGVFTETGNLRYENDQISLYDTFDSSHFPTIVGKCRDCKIGAGEKVMENQETVMEISWECQEACFCKVRELQCAQSSGGQLLPIGQYQGVGLICGQPSLTTSHRETHSKKSGQELKC